MSRHGAGTGSQFSVILQRQRQLGKVTSACQFDVRRRCQPDDRRPLGNRHRRPIRR